MNRLCERPGCSQPAEVAYGFDADSLIVWLDAMAAVQGLRHGVLCRRHADAMVVPLGWMLDDRREPTLRLFKAPAVEVAPRPRRERHIRGRDDTIEQLRLVVPPEDPTTGTPVAELTIELAGLEPILAAGAEPERDDELRAVAEVEFVEAPWVPVFDSSDDLHGLLNARGRLLSRAFHGAPTEPA